MSELKLELKRILIKTLKLDDVTPEGIEDSAPLFGAGLGLDSIDALELAVALERHYRIAIPDEQVARKAFASIDALAAFVTQQRSPSA